MFVNHKLHDVACHYQIHSLPERAKYIFLSSLNTLFQKEITHTAHCKHPPINASKASCLVTWESTILAWHSLPLVAGVDSWVFSLGFDNPHWFKNGFQWAWVVVFSRLSWWGSGAVRTWFIEPRTCYFLRDLLSPAKPSPPAPAPWACSCHWDRCEHNGNVWTWGIITFLQ